MSFANIREIMPEREHDSLPITVENNEKVDMVDVLIKRFEQRHRLNQNAQDKKIVIQEKKVKQFSFFKKIGTFFNTNPKNQDLNMNNESNLDNTVNKLINANSLLLVYQMIERGYELSADQQIKIDTKIQKNIEENNLKEIGEIIKNGYHINSSILIDNLLINADKLVPEIRKSDIEFWKKDNISTLLIEEATHKFENYLTLLKKEGIKTKKFKKIWDEHLNIDIDYMNTKAVFINRIIRNIAVELFIHIQDKIELKTYLNMLTVVKEIEEYRYYLYNNKTKNKVSTHCHFFMVFEYSCKSVIAKMENQLNYSFKEDKEILVNKIEDNLVEKYINQIVSQNTQNNQRNKISLDYLPSEIISKMAKLNEGIKELHEETSEIDSHSWQELEKLWTIHLYNALEKYAKIATKNVDKAQSVENKSANMLLIETIDNITEILNEKLLQINQHKLSNLSVIQRQTKELKKLF